MILQVIKTIFVFMICLLLSEIVSAENKKRVPVKIPSGKMSLPLNKWTKITDVPQDPYDREIAPGRGAYMCYAPESGLFYRYGGYTPTDDNSLWSFELLKREWGNSIKTDYTWPPPKDRPGAGAWWSMAYDAKRKVIWFHGGFGLAGRKDKSLFRDIWQYEIKTGKFKAMKSKKFPTGIARIVYDSVNDVIIRAPAYNREWSARHNKSTWIYNIASNTWESKKTPKEKLPKDMAGGGFVFNPDIGKAVYISKESKTHNVATYTYDVKTNIWEKLVISESPPSRVYPGIAYDSHNKKILLYGGVGQPAKGYGYLHRGGGVQLYDTWVLDIKEKSWKKLSVGTPQQLLLKKVGWRAFNLNQSMDYDSKNKTVVVTCPNIGVWALRYSINNEDKPVALADLPKIEKPKYSDEPIYKLAEPNKKLINLEPLTWVKLGGGGAIGGGEIPFVYDESNGYAYKFGGCNNGGTTFASGYGNDLSAYDPATERWIALRWVDPCAPPRPKNGCTRYYAYDSDKKITWFAGGTSGNNLGSSYPMSWKKGTQGTWYYNGLKDKYILATSTIARKLRIGAGVGVGYDKANHFMLTIPKAYSEHVMAFHTVEKIWKVSGKAAHARLYNYSAYIDSKKELFIPTVAKDGIKSWSYNGKTGLWKDLKPGGDLPKNFNKRPGVAYDPFNDVVLIAGEKESYILDIKKNEYTLLKTKTPTPKIQEHMIFDTRHKVFIGTARGHDCWAFKYK